MYVFVRSGYEVRRRKRHYERGLVSARGRRRDLAERAPAYDDRVDRDDRRRQPYFSRDKNRGGLKRVSGGESGGGGEASDLPPEKETETERDCLDF